MKPDCEECGTPMAEIIDGIHYVGKCELDPKRPLALFNCECGTTRAIQWEDSMKEYDKMRISDLLCSALEGGSNYWAQIVEFFEPRELKFRVSPENVYRHLDYPLNFQGAIRIADPEGAHWTLDLYRIGLGLKTFQDKYPIHYRNWVNDNEDAESGDVFLQCCLFGDVKYG